MRIQHLKAVGLYHSVKKIAAAKVKGDSSLQGGQVQEALKHYYEAYLQLRAACPSIKDPMAASLANQRAQHHSPEEKAELEALKRAVHGNMCVVYAKQEKWDRVSKMAEEVLVTGEGLNPQEVVCKANLKLMYRLAVARLYLGDTEKAKHWAQCVLQVEPQNSEVGKSYKALALMNQVKQREKEGDQKLRDQMSKMFR